MEKSEVEKLLNEMYTMIQDARSVPLSQDKCIIERERALDLMEDIISKWPVEVRDAQAVLASRTDIITQARREGEGIIRNAREQADQMITKEAIYEQARAKCEEMILQTKAEMELVQNKAFSYLAESLQETERAVSASLGTLNETRKKFEAAVTETKKNTEA